MNKIEVDPKLFIKCRVCLDETGQYQIVPTIQMQIKYCFDVDVEPFDGLPQLVCKKCESILNTYAGMKQIVQEKQKNLKSKLSSGVKIDNIDIIQQQDTVSSTQADTENKNKIDELTRYNRKTPPPQPTRSSTETVLSNFSQSQRQKRKTILGNKTNKAWQSTYTKYFVCRYCAKTFKDKMGINNHIRKWCKFYTKYSKMNKACLVSLNKVGSKPNLTGTIDYVVCDENKIIQSREATHYILYTNKPNDQCNSSDSSDEDFVFDKKKRKRQRLSSRSSDETIVIDHNTEKKSDDEKLAKARKPEKNKNTQIDSDIECLDIEDSDSNSTKSSVKTKDCESITPHYEQTKTFNDKMLNNIIAMCSNKYINRLNSSDGGLTNKGREESSLKHKILSIGRKVIHSKGINTIGLLRYMEQKNLDVIWVLKMDTKGTIKARSREIGDSNKSVGWENITSVLSHSYVVEDFADIYIKNSEIEACINENIEGNQVPQVTEQCQGNSKEICQESTLMKLTKEDQSGGDSSYNKSVSVNMPTCVDTSERKGNDNNSYLRAVLDADRNWTKLLNANPVANPKQLPKKNTFNEPASIVKIYADEPKNDAEIAEHSNTENGNVMLHMPIITSTVSLAPPVDKEQPNIVCSNQNANEMNSVSSIPQSTLPKIKVKPVSELMSDEALSQQNTSSFVATTGWAVNNESQRENIVLQPNTMQPNQNTNMVYFATPVFNNIIPVQNDFVYYTKGQDVGGEVGMFNPTVSQSSSILAPKKKEYVKLHTVELPNYRTESPYRYFQKLLQMHNIILLDSIYSISSSMNCLMKFKVVFQQDSNSPVLLSLLLLCENNIFCIKARDKLLKELDLTTFSPNWQWEILKVFKGDDIAPKLLESAKQFGNPVYTYTNYFTNLLRSIVFLKE